jgi:hypothetical protein
LQRKDIRPLFRSCIERHRGLQAPRTPRLISEEFPTGFTKGEHRMTDGSERNVQLSFSSALGAYLQRVQELGAVEGLEGAIEINPTLKPVLEAMHHVLAGGEVQVKVLRDGQQGIFLELQQRAVQATQETNALNQLSGNVVVTAV